MRYAFPVFAPYRSARKAAIFGSARTQPDDPLYDQTRALAAELAARDWMVITGAGPGIMEAGIEGAGAENSFGVSIRLPFEAATTQFLADDPKLVNFRYFFTRKLTFVKESDAFVLLPGGFGTLDEAFELLTLVQTGQGAARADRAARRPRRHLLDAWREFVEAELLEPRLHLARRPRPRAASPTTSHVARRRGHRLLPQLPLAALRRRRPRAADAARARRRASSPRSTRSSPTSSCRARSSAIEATTVEIADGDFAELDRAAFRFDRRNWARLRELIDALNRPYREA